MSFPFQLSSLLPFLQYAPDFVQSRFPSCLLGMIIGYTIMLFFWGRGEYPEAPHSFFDRLKSISFTLAVCWAMTRLFRNLLQRVLPVFDSPSPAASPTVEKVGDEE